MTTELRKALTSSGDGAALNIDDIDMVLHEDLKKLQPLTELISVTQSEGKTHDYRVRSSHPQGWFEGENTGATVKNGVYVRKTVSLKIGRIWGSVTGFARAVTRRFLDALEEEVSGALEGMADLHEFGLLYGASNDVSFTGDAYQYSGVLPRLYSYAPDNVIDGGGAKVTLDMLDQVLAKAAGFRQVRKDPSLWAMGLRMKQIVDGLQTKVQLPLQTATLADGKIEMAAYGGRGIFETDYLVPESATTSPACTGVIAAGGSLPAATYNYRISSVTMYGEQVAGTASANVTSASTNNTADLTWTADATAMNYMIWRRVGAGDYQLLDIIPAKTYDADGKVNGTVASYSDTGARSLITQVMPLETGEQHIVFLNIDPQRGVQFKGLIDDMGDPVDTMVQFVELGRTKDSFDFFLKTYNTVKVPYSNLIAELRHVKLA